MVIFRNTFRVANCLYVLLVICSENKRKIKMAPMPKNIPNMISLRFEKVSTLSSF